MGNFFWRNTGKLHSPAEANKRSMLEIEVGNMEIWNLIKRIFFIYIYLEIPTTKKNWSMPIVSLFLGVLSISGRLPKNKAFRKETRRFPKN